MFSNGNSTIEHSLFKIGKGDFKKSFSINHGYICFKWLKTQIAHCPWILITSILFKLLVGSNLLLKLWLNRCNKKQVISAIIFSEHFRVHAYWTGNSVVSLLSIKSAISEDTGNYSCILPNTGEKVTASLHILKGIFYSGSNVNVMEKMESHLPLAFGMN